MVDDLQRRVVELRFIEGIEKVEHVPYLTGDEFWVRFNHPLDFGKFEDIAKKHGCVMVKFARLPSKLPRPIAEILWDGVSYVIARNMSGWAKFTASLGLEPDGIAKIATDLHGPYQIFIARQEEGIQILYEYLGLKYVPPTPLPKPATPVKSPTPPAIKPAAPSVPRPAVPIPPATTKSATPIQPLPANPAPATPTQKPEPPKPNCSTC
jgi:hypothetical protein